MIIFGVSGAGKTTIGKLLAEELDWAFYEADDFHSPGNIEKMRHGVSLTDEDRWPWLESLRELITRCLAAGENAVLALFRVEGNVSRLPTGEFGREVRFFARRLRARCQAIAAQARTLHESRVAAKSVR